MRVDVYRLAISDQTCVHFLLVFVHTSVIASSPVDLVPITTPATKPPIARSPTVTAIPMRHFFFVLFNFCENGLGYRLRVMRLRMIYLFIILNIKFNPDN